MGSSGLTLLTSSQDNLTERKAKNWQNSRANNLMSNDKKNINFIQKKSKGKKLKSTQIHLTNLPLVTWDQDKKKKRLDF